MAHIFTLIATQPLSYGETENGETNPNILVSVHDSKKSALLELNVILDSLVDSGIINESDARSVVHSVGRRFNSYTKIEGYTFELRMLPLLK